MGKRQIQARSTQSLLDQLIKEFGPDWYQKVRVKFLKQTPSELIVEISPFDESATDESGEPTLGSYQTKVQLPPISELESKYAEPTVQVEISTDKMTASVVIIPGLKRILPTAGEIEKALLNAGVSYGIDRQRIEEALKEERLFSPVPVAFGKQPKPPKDAQIRLLFPETGYFPIRVDQAEKIDPASLYKIFTCEKDQLLAVKEPAVDGEDGFTVTAEVIKTQKPKDFSLQNHVGENVYLSDDGYKILAACAGQPFFKNSKIHVREIFVVHGDLDYSVGNIDFNGTVLVRGNAEGPFKIIAQGDVVISGILGEVQINCRGSLMVKGGIFGRSKGIVKVGKDLLAKFVSEARIFCEGKILVEDYIMNSVVVCKGDLSVTGRGIIAGGVVKAKGNIIATELGSKFGVKTLVMCGVNYEIEEKLEQCEIAAFEIARNLAKISENEQKTRQRLSQTKQPQEREELRKELIELEQEKLWLEKHLFKLKRAIDVLLKVRKFEGVTANSRIILRRVCHPNVKITIGHESVNVQETMNVREFYIDRSTGKIAYK